MSSTAARILAPDAIASLAEKGVLHPVTLAKRNRAWEARELFDPINDVELERATPLAPY